MRSQRALTDPLHLRGGPDRHRAVLTVKPGRAYTLTKNTTETYKCLKTKKKTPYSYLDCGRGLVRVTVIYLEYTITRRTSLCVYIGSPPHRKKEEYM